MTNDETQAPRERIERMRERVEQELLHVYGDRDDWAESLLTLIDAQAPVIRSAGMESCRMGRRSFAAVLLSALEDAVDDLCGEGR